MTRITALAALPLLLACAGDAETAPTELVFEAAAPSGASAVYLDGTLDEAGLTLQLWVRDAGDVFGVAAHLIHETPAREVVADRPLGSDDEALHLVVDAPGDLSVGGTRLAPSLGDVSMDGPTRLATLTLPPPSGPTTFAVERITIRRSDGTFVPTSGYGAAVVERAVSR